MSFGKYFQYLTAVELDPKRAKMLEHNLDLCKRHATFGFVANKRVFCGDYTKLMRTQIGRSDIIFFDPPWGGNGLQKRDICGVVPRKPENA